MAQIAETVDLDTKAFIGQRLIVQAASGAGKSYGIRRILESTFASSQHIVLDIEDEFFTLREKFGYAIIGGEGADVPLPPMDHAGNVAREILAIGVSTIVQLNDLNLSAQRGFIDQFIRGLMEAPKSNWHPTTIALDETHLYAPQGGLVASSAALVSLCTQGRKRGFSAIFATQRLSSISKDVTAQCPNRIIGRVDQNLDRRAGADTLGFSPSDKNARGLMELEAGQMWFVGPALSKRPVLDRFLKCETTHIEAGQNDVPRPPAPEALAEMLAGLTINDEEEDVEGEIVKVESRPDPKALAREFEKGRSVGADEGRREGFEHGYKAASLEWKETAKQAQALLQEAQSVLLPVARISGVRETANGSVPGARKAIGQPPAYAPEINKATSGSPTVDRGLKPSSLKILSVFSGHYPRGMTYAVAAKRAGISPRSSQFHTYRQELLDGGYIEERADGKLYATTENNDLPPAPNTIDEWNAKLSGSPKRIFELLGSYPSRGFSREAIAEYTGISPTSSGLPAALRELVGLSLIIKREDKLYEIDPDLWVQ